MGMDLEPIAPTIDAPKYQSNYKVLAGKYISGEYNWSGWRWITDKLQDWNVDISEFAGSNDGDIISANTCIEVANAIEQHLGELTQEEQEWLKPHIILWRTCGGYRQY